jgi:hypothetical protein
MKEKIDNCFKIVESFNHRDNLFELPLQDYSELQDLYDSFKNYLKLWFIIEDFDH